MKELVSSTAGYTLVPDRVNRITLVYCIHMHEHAPKFVDDAAERVEKLIANSTPVRTIRKSQVLSAILGAIGFALFIDGILKLFVTFPAWASLLLGLLMMAATGLLIKNLER